MFDEELIIGDPQLSISEGVILPWSKKNNMFYENLIDDVTNHLGINKHVKWIDINEDKKKEIIFGNNRPMSYSFSYFSNKKCQEFIYIYLTAVKNAHIVIFILKYHKMTNLIYLSV